MLTDQLKTEALRRAMRSLDAYTVVDIHRERDHHIENETGEDVARWEVYIQTGKRRVTVRNSLLDEAIVDAEHQASVAYDDEVERRNNARQAALAKLTPEDRAALNLA